MTVQCESAAPPPIFRPEARRRLLSAFILAKNTPAGGSCFIYNRKVGFR